jgi:3D (Asp-Asp-Asp) domain-containing protein
MKLFKLTRAVAFVAAVISTTSCSTRHLRVAKLKEGVRYEVRKAVDAKTTFRPEMMSSYYFTLTPTKAPLIAGTTQHLTVRTTAYCHTEADHIVYGAKSAVGTPLRFGTVRSAAADWSRYPVGTVFRIANQPGIVYQVDDYGSALVGTNTIDLYRPSQESMRDWGVRNVDIEVLRWGSVERSMQLMKDRTQFPHVRRMFDDLQRHVGQMVPSFRSPVLTAML